MKWIRTRRAGSFEERREAARLKRINDEIDPDARSIGSTPDARSIGNDLRGRAMEGRRRRERKRTKQSPRLA
jgi:hypothetical protein